MEPEETPVDDGTAFTPETAEENISLSEFTAKLAEPVTAVAEPGAAEPEPETPRRAKNQHWKALRARTTELTRRLRETEAERDALKGNGSPVVPGSAPPPAATPPVVQAPAVATPPRAAAPLPPVKAASDDPEPDSTKYEDLTQWMRDHSRWSAREELRAAHAEQQKLTQAETQRIESARLETQWKASTAAAKTKYPDFEQIAYAPTRIPKGSLVDAWILEHKTGPDVLYHLQKTPQELDAMLALPLLDQVEALTLLSQRLSGARQTAVVTGAAAAPIAQPVSRPPTPVRTGPMRSADEPPDPDSTSLSDFTRFHGTPRSRRARS